MKRLSILFAVSFIALVIINSCEQKQDLSEKPKDITEINEAPPAEGKNDVVEIAKPDNPNAPKLEIPEWAKPLNLTFPENMEFLAGKSSRSYYEKDGVNSINFVFNGTYKQAMNEAERIAKIMNVPMDINFKTALEHQKRAKEDLMKSGQPLPPHMPEMKGAIYSNLVSDTEKLKKLDFRKSVIAEEGGRLIIILIDNRHLEKRNIK